MDNRSPLTWACDCGQMNLLNSKHCFACGSHKDEAWSEEDRNRVVFTEDSDGKQRIIGFDHKKP